MKILHSADIHFSNQHQESALASLRVFADTGGEQGVDLFVIAGDLFDRAVQNTASSGLPELQRVIQEMMQIAPVVAVRGTPTHDIDGAYDLLEETSAEHSFTMIEPTETYGLMYGDLVFVAPDDHEDVTLLVIGCPEPSKEWVIADSSGMSKDEAEAAMIEGMKKIFLGFAAVRKQYPDIPCLFIYHGEVKGATFQNGRTADGGIGRDDLEMIGADYIALGHIHEAQQIGDLPAYYPGSAFPVTWGEPGQKRFNEVTFDNEATFPDDGAGCIYVDRHPFPHPPRKKIALMPSELFEDLLIQEWEGYQTWLVIRGSKEQLAGIDTDEMLAHILDKGALDGSKVTTDTIAVETVRAGEIQNADGLPNKLRIYAENSEHQVSQDTIDKAWLLEKIAKSEGRTHTGAHIRIDSLSLRGAIGIRKGTGKDEIYLDLSQYDSGLISLPGPNGLGKTTLIENLHPYPQLLTRKGPLQSQFELRDSWRDLYFTDCRTGSQYRALIHIDGQNDSGSCEYHLYKDGQPLTNGRKADYEEKIDELFGPLSLYVRSAFVAQKTTKSTPDLGSATQGEKKELFRELSGLDYLQEYSISAKNRAKAIEDDTLTDRGKIETLSTMVAGLPLIEADLATANDRQAIKGGEIQIIKGAGETLRKRSEELTEKINANREIESKADGIRKQRKELDDNDWTLEKDRSSYTVALSAKGDAETNVKTYEKIQSRIEAIQADEKTFTDARNKALEKYTTDSKVVGDQERELQVEREKVRSEVSSKQVDKAASSAKVDAIDIELQKDIATTCPTCKQTLPLNVAETLRVERQELKCDLLGWQETVLSVDQDIIAFEKRVSEFDEKINALEWPEELEAEAFDYVELNKLRDESSALGPIETARNIINLANVAEAKIEAIDVQLKANNEKSDDLHAGLEALEAKYDDPANEEFQSVTRQLEETREKYTTAQTEQATIEANIKALNVRIDDLKAKKSELAEIKKGLDAKLETAREWRYLEQACGPNGIQALELDALAPSIADVANKLLSTAYDSRFQIEFRTTRIAGKGSKTKQVEDFEIVIHDNDDGTEQALDTLSGGQGVWIKKAIYDAFGIIRAKNTGTQFLTAFLDEADGALDPDSKAHYFRLLEAAHEESGRHHTILITHSEAIQEMIGQRIEMGELGAVE